jgi:hypothetical protein
MLDVWKPVPGSFRELPAGVLLVQSRAHNTHAVTVMVDFGEVQPDLDVDPGFAPPAHPRLELVPSAQGIRAFAISFCHHRTVVQPVAHAAQHIFGAHDETTTDAIGIY